MNALPLISIIVPVYNSEEYIERCVDSILNQTFRNIEIVLVDDGSTDSSSTICKNYEIIDHRVKYFYKENGGLSSARNKGLEVCKGDYIAFTDSDDWIEPQMLEILLSLCNTDRTIANTRTSSVNDKGQKKLLKIDDYQDKSSDDYLRSLLLHMGDSSVATKLFKREIIGENRFDETKLNEDVLFMFSISDRFDNIVYDEKAGYNYFLHVGSISRVFGKSVHDMVYNSRAIHSFVIENKPQFKEEAERFEIFQAISFLCACPVGYDRKKDNLCSETKKYLKNNFLRGLKNRYLKKRDKIRLILLCISPSLTSFLISLKSKTKRYG